LLSATTHHYHIPFFFHLRGSKIKKGIKIHTKIAQVLYVFHMPFPCWGRDNNLSLLTYPVDTILAEHRPQGQYFYDTFSLFLSLFS